MSGLSFETGTSQTFGAILAVAMLINCYYAVRLIVVGERLELGRRIQEFPAENLICNELNLRPCKYRHASSYDEKTIGIATISNHSLIVITIFCSQIYVCEFQ